LRCGICCSQSGCCFGCSIRKHMLTIVSITDDVVKIAWDGLSNGMGVGVHGRMLVFTTLIAYGRCCC
jgi:hypothetical protein